MQENPKWYIPLKFLPKSTAPPPPNEFWQALALSIGNFDKIIVLKSKSKIASYNLDFHLDQDLQLSASMMK
jgi:hypothetical protein